MIKVSVNINGKYVDVSLQEMCIINYKEISKSWIKSIENEIDNALNIKTEKDYQTYIENNSFVKMITNQGYKFDYLELKRFYEVLKKSKYNEMFDDDILKYISYIRELNFFDIIEYKLDKNNPNFDEWLDSKNPFKLNYNEEELKNKYSFMDLLPLKYGMNAIRAKIIFAEKKIWQ